MYNIEDDTAHPATSITTPQVIRITSGGRMRSWVDYALKFLKDQPGRPLTFQTISTSAKPDATRATSASQSRSNAAIPRLISVVEIIKREYLKNAEVQPVMSGLHQYNCLEHYEEMIPHSNQTGENLDAEGLRSLEIIAALEGKNHLKLRRTPCLKITLSTSPLPELEGSQTYQPPAVRRLSKAAKARWKRRTAKPSDVDM